MNFCCNVFFVFSHSQETAKDMDVGRLLPNNETVLQSCEFL